MADVLSNAVKLAVHEQSFGWQTAANIAAQIGTLNAWTPDESDATLSAIGAAGWISLGDSPVVTGRSVGLVGDVVVWSCDDITFDTTGEGGNPFDGVVIYDVDTDMFIALYELSDVFPGDVTIIAPNASGLARF